jgi:hypothetical protein
MMTALVRSPRNRPKEGVSMAPGPRQDSEVDLLGAVQLVHRHLDETLCEDVFWRYRG